MIYGAGRTNSGGEQYCYRRKHRLDCYTLALIQAGDLVIETAAKEYALTANNLLLIPPEVMYSAHTTGPEHLIKEIWLIFKPSPAMLPYLELPGCAEDIAHVDLRKNPHQQAIADSCEQTLTWLHTARPLGQTLAMNALERLWFLLADSLQIPQHRPDSRIQAVLHYVQENLAARLSVKELAEVANLSPDRFAHLFQKIVGASPAKYIETLRIEVAKGLLLAEDLPVGIIAQRVGFENPYHFSACFRKCTGCSPSRFRTPAH